MKTKIVILFFLFSQANAYSNNNQSYFKFAEALASEEMYSEAITEYKRLLFSIEIKEPEILGEIWLNLAKCYRNSNDEIETMKSYRNSFLYLKDTGKTDLLYKEICVFYISRGKFGLARETLEKMKNVQNDQIQHNLMILSYLVENNWDMLINYLYEISWEKVEIEKIQKIVRIIKSFESKKSFLDILGFFSPGIAYVVNGNISDGCESMLIDYLFFDQILIASTPLEKVLNGILFMKLFSRSQQKWKSFSDRGLQAKKLKYEEKIFEIIFENQD